MAFTFSPICNYCKYGKVMYKKIGKIYLISVFLFLQYLHREDCLCPL